MGWSMGEKIMKHDIYENLEAEKIYEAIAEGVDRAVSRVIWRPTDSPGAYFYDAIEIAAENAFKHAALMKD